MNDQPAPCGVILVLDPSNSVEGAQQFIHSALKQSLKPSVLRVMLLGHSDEQANCIRAACGDFRGASVMMLPRNCGWLHAMRLAAQDLATDYILLVGTNEVLAPDYFEKIASMAARHPAAGVLVGDVVETGVPGKGDRRYSLRPAVESALVESGTNCLEALKQAGNWVGCSFVLKRSVWEEAGGAREELGAYSLTYAALAAGMRHGYCHLDGVAVYRIGTFYGQSGSPRESVFHVLDIAARMAHLWKTESGNPNHAREQSGIWLASVRKEVICQYQRVLSDSFLLAKQCLRIQQGEPFNPASLLIRLIDRLMGLFRRYSANHVGRMLTRYEGDVSCYDIYGQALIDSGANRFSFGRNWEAYVDKSLTPEREKIAQQDLLKFLEKESLEGLSFLDVGCGSGLSSLAAFRAGAARVRSIDVDPSSVRATTLLWEREGRPANWTIASGSVLDEEFIKEQASADIVYSWGVLHHTGRMWQAIENAARLVKPGGLFFIALYDKTTPLGYWLEIKKRYNRASSVLKRWMELRYIVGHVMWPNLRYGNNPFRPILQYKKKRGMSFYADVKDWLGGYPYEEASIEEVKEFASIKLGLTCEKAVVEKGHQPQYLFRRPG